MPETQTDKSAISRVANAHMDRRLTLYAMVLYLVIFISAYLYKVYFAASGAILLQNAQSPDPEYTTSKSIKKVLVVGTDRRIGGFGIAVFP